MRATKKRRSRMLRYLTVFWVTALLVSMPAPRHWLWQMDLTAWAAIPWRINYQGRLTDIGGSAVSGSQTMVFRLYDASTDGTEQWEESHSVNLNVTDNGIFSVVLGDTTALTSVDFNIPLWLSVQVNGDAEMTPRQRLTASGYAMNADQLDSLDSTKFMRTDINTSTAGKVTITNAGTGTALANNKP